ncbi:hypothetical protein TNCV_1933411 [Trichonephila clavipes]|nr:hypothetical protein TNCV_1933411 [Trichonephila clavipes]
MLGRYANDWKCSRIAHCEMPLELAELRSSWCIKPGDGGTSGQKSHYLHGDQTQDALVRQVIEKTVTSYGLHA